ncbi:MAG: hypothetical protein LBS21_09415 [Clostridiales bacterium]|jgi:hypothetical protein|nr:hypothetical protein [Clostridiales bacterium]
MGRRGYGLQNEIIKNFNLTDYKAIYLMFKYCPNLLGEGYFTKEAAEIKTYDDLQKYYKCIKKYSQSSLDALFITDENFKKAEKWLIDKFHQQKLVRLYNKFYEQAIDGDTKSVKEFISLAGRFLKEDDAESEVTQFLKSIDIPDESENSENKI